MRIVVVSEADLENSKVLVMPAPVVKRMGFFAMALYEMIAARDIESHVEAVRVLPTGQMQNNPSHLHAVVKIAMTFDSAADGSTIRTEVEQKIVIGPDDVLLESQVGVVLHAMNERCEKFSDDFTRMAAVLKRLVMQPIRRLDDVRAG